MTQESIEYTWNHANLLTQVTFRAPNGTVTKTVSYRYDGLGRRIGKSVDDNGDTTVDRSETYIYDGAGLYSSGSGSLAPGHGGEGQGEGTAIAIQGVNGASGQHGWVDNLVLVFEDTDGAGLGSSTLNSRLLHGPLVDQVFAAEDASGNVLWALSDQLGTPRDWADFDGVSSSVVRHTRFTAFGAIESVTDGSGVPLDPPSSPLPSFTGQLYDADVDLLYYRARWYDPVTGKFLSDDPLTFAAGDPNISRLTGNEAVSHSDPSGLDGMDIKIRLREQAKWPSPTPRPKIDVHTYPLAGVLGVFVDVGTATQPGSSGGVKNTHIKNGIVSVLEINSVHTPGGCCNSTPAGDGGTIDVSLIDHKPGRYRVPVDVVISTIFTTNNPGPGNTTGGHVRVSLPGGARNGEPPIGWPDPNEPTVHVKRGVHTQVLHYEVDVDVRPRPPSDPRYPVGNNETAVLRINPTMSFPPHPPGAVSHTTLTTTVSVGGVYPLP